MTEIDEVIATLERLNSQLQDLVVRGLRVCGPEHLSALRATQSELARTGANHLAERLVNLAAAIDSDDRRSAAALLETQTSLRVFERVLSMRVAEESLAAVVECSEIESCEANA